VKEDLIVGLPLLDLRQVMERLKARYPKNMGDRGSTNRKVAVSIPDGVIRFLIDIKSFRPHYGPGIDSASNRNEYQEYFLAVKAAGA